MPQFEIELDGKRFILEGDRPPTESEARRAVRSAPIQFPPLPQLAQGISRQVAQTTLGGFRPGQQVSNALLPGLPLGAAIQQIPQPAIETALPIAGGVLGAGLPGIAIGAGLGTAAARAIGKVRNDTGKPLTFDGLSQSSKEVLMAGAGTAAGTLVFGKALEIAGKGVSSLFGSRGLMTGATGRQQRLFQLQRDRSVRGFRQQQQQVTAQRDTTLQGVRQNQVNQLQTSSAQTRKEIANLTAEQETLHRSMQEVAEQSVLKVRKLFPDVARKTSEQYRALVDDALNGLDDVEVPFDQLLTAIQKRFANDPELLGSAFKSIGISEDLAAVLTRMGPEGVQQFARGQSLTVKNVLKRISKLRQGIRAPAKGSRRVYSFEEKVIDDTSSALMEVLEQNGVQGLEKASAFWAQWAPIRNQAFRDFRPFLQADTETATGISRLIRVAQGRDPGNARFVSALEDRLGTSLSDDLTGLVQRMTTNQKARVAAKLNQELRSGEVRRMSQRAVDDAKEVFQRTSGQVESAQQAATGQLARQQFPARQALQQKRGFVRAGLHVGSVVLLYQFLRRAIDAVIPRFGGESQ